MASFANISWGPDVAISEALKNIATLGYHSYRESLKLRQEVSELQKSLRDNQAIGGSAGPMVAARQLTALGPQTAKKPNARMLRTLAETNPWVRAGIKIYRDRIGRAKWQIMPYDPQEPMDEGVKREVEKLLAHPTPKNTPYSTLKEMMVEDFLVLGHGAIRKYLNNDLTSRGLDIVDAARFAFNTEWQGEEDKPHYAILDESYTTPVKWLADPEAMVLFNVPRSYDVLGLSHVEVLYNTILSLSDGDEFLKNQVMQPNPSGMLNLGEGATQQQVSQTRAMMQQLRYPFLITAGNKNAAWTPFLASPKDLQILQAQEWFVREVAAVFDVSTAELKLAVDTSRANTTEMTAITSEGLITLLRAVRDLENAEFILKYGPYEEHNCYLDYVALNQRDEAAQTAIASQQMNVGIASLNEARRQVGYDPIDSPLANEPMIATPSGPVPLSFMEEQYYGNNVGQDGNKTLMLPAPRTITGKKNAKTNKQFRGR